MAVGIDPIALTALRGTIRRKRTLAELFEGTDEEMHPSAALLDEVNGRLQLKLLISLGEDILASGGLTHRSDIGDNKGIKPDDEQTEQRQA
jgi:hypothetical protein